MTFEEKKYYSDLKPHKLQMPFGNFYLCDGFVVSELNEGIHFDWEMIKTVMDKVIEYYGKNTKWGYISHRVNSYSMDPQTWELVDQTYNSVISSGAIVYYNKMTSINAALEKHFAPVNIKRFDSLEAAIEWTLFEKK
ncbi:hypothetical protein ABI125_09655 [Tamlana crocina]